MGKKFFETVIIPNLNRAFNGETHSMMGWVTIPVMGNRYMIVTCHPVKDDDGSIPYVAVNARDLTEEHVE